MVLLVAIGTVTLGQVPHADTLLAYKHYFELRNLLQSRSDSLLPHKKLYYQAHLDNFFNRLNESNEHIAVLLKQYRNQLSAKEASKLLEKKERQSREAVPIWCTFSGMLLIWRPT